MNANLPTGILTRDLEPAKEAQCSGCFGGEPAPYREDFGMHLCDECLRDYEREHGDQS